MGYDLHITKAADWSGNEGAEIDLAEWTAYVASDPEMRLDGTAEAPLSSGETLRYESEGLAVWTAYSGHDPNGNMAWFDLRGGNVVVKNPDEEIIAKMLSIADRLGGQVQGDDGEFYPLPSAAPQTAERLEAKSWWRRLLRL